MSVSLQIDPDTLIYGLHVRGVLKRSELSVCEKELASLITAGERPHILVTLEDFAGWEKGEDWNNLDFMFTHGDKIAKIAIVGAGAREAEVKAFTGAGLRPTPVRFFPAAEAGEAKAWLIE